LSSLGFDNSQLTLEISDLELQKSDILKSLLVLDFTLGESGLQDLDLLVKKGELIVSSDQLGSQNISFIDYILVVFL
jgi:hypothetical protein